MPSAQEPLPSGVPPRQIPCYAHGFCEQSKLLQKVPLQRKGRKTLIYGVCVFEDVDKCRQQPRVCDVNGTCRNTLITLTLLTLTL